MHTNRLSHETSPYLLQHAHNPVDWFPWGADAFAKARAENKPIFLSIGYSTCHWCHVMERESFENESLAAVMNRHFVCIKVDREERPEIDKIYMTAVQAATGNGGWPMSVWLTPELKPFYCGTYFPPETFRQLLERVAEVWEANHDGVLAQAKQITDALSQYTAVGRGEPLARPLDDTPLRLAYEQFHGSHDPVHGGFGTAPKFPRPVALNFLFRYAARSGDPDARAMALHTLRAMADGGLFDHLGGGFHRYSVDDRWLVSHFEKMLYDQAQLVGSYLDAYQLTRDPFHADIARRTCDYVLRDMTSPNGGFYAAEDADSEGVEGKFYAWTRAEVEAVLRGSGIPAATGLPPTANRDKNVAPTISEDRIAAFCRAYGVTTSGNWEHGVNILHVITPGEFAAERAALFAARAKRVRPHRDEKVLTSWNGLMITALARAAQVLDEPRYAAAAARAAELLLRAPELRRTGNVTAVVDDYACLATGLVDLYEATFTPRWLTQAVALTDVMLEKFYDSRDGGFFMTTGADPIVILRMKEDYDGAEPSGNSVAALLLLRLAAFTDNKRYREAAAKTLALFSHRLHSQPFAIPQMACALDWALGPTQEIVIAGADSSALQRVVHETYLPNKILLGPGAQPWTEPMKPVDGQPTAYVCRNRACRLPTTDPATLRETLFGTGKNSY